MNRTSLSGAFLSLLLLSALLLVFFSSAPVHAAASWNVQTVDSMGAGTGNGYCPIVVDSNDIPSIAYTRSNSSDYLLWYAKWNSSLGGFNIQQITTGAATDMALDTSNNPNIFCGALRAGFKYASWTGLNWTSEPVDPSYAVYGALALDSTGNPHAAYSDGQALKYASRSGSGWTTETVDTATEIPIHLSLAIDSNNKPYILYSKPDLKLATLENSGWNIQNVILPAVTLPDPRSYVGNLVLDSKGRPHFVYSFGSLDDATIKYAGGDGFSWKTQTVASGLSLADIRYPGFLALDSLDYPHICYVGGGRKLMYAVWTGVDWNIQPVGSAQGRDPVYLALDSNRIPHISYRVGSIGIGFTINIMYATAAEPVPLYSPLPLQLGLAAVAIGAAVAVAYLWKKKNA